MEIQKIQIYKTTLINKNLLDVSPSLISSYIISAIVIKQDSTWIKADMLISKTELRI